MVLRFGCCWWLVWSTGTLGLGATWFTHAAACVEERSLFTTAIADSYQALQQSKENRQLGVEEARLIPDHQPVCDLTTLSMMTKVMQYLPSKYVDPSRFDYPAMLLSGLQAIQNQVPAILIDDADFPKKIRIAINKVEQTFVLEDGLIKSDDTLFLFLRGEIMPFLQRHITDVATRCSIEYAVTNGVLATLDPHNQKLNEKETEDLKQSTRGAFGGLGLKIGIKDDGLVVVNPMPNTPAAKAGLAPKDRILQIDEASTVNMSLAQAAHLLRGIPQTKVNVTVLREGWPAAKVFVLEREEIFLESVKSSLLSGDVGYVRIQAFQSSDDRDGRDRWKDASKKSTSAELDAHIQRLVAASKAKQLQGLIMDLRHNPGGLLEEAVAIADRFVQEGDLVITVGTHNRRSFREARKATKLGNEKEFPIVVLINGGSASASEIVAGALKNHQRALLLGETTFGKGSVQTVIPFKTNQAMNESKETLLRLTTAQYLLPGGISIQRSGVTPDIALFPGIVDPNGLHLFVEEELHSREKDRKAALHANDAYVQASYPELKLWYLRDIKATAAKEEEIDEDEIRVDFEMELAQSILLHTKATDRRQMLQDTASLLAAKKQEEQAKIAKKLSALGVNWQPVAKDVQQASVAELQPSLTFVEKEQASGSKKPTSAFLPGTAALMRGEVVNPSTGAIGQLYGIANSPVLSSMEEFAFGYLGPGSKHTWQVPIKLPSFLHPGVYGVEFKTISGQDSNQQQTLNATFAVDPLPAARFAFRLALDDATLGNGDGLLQVGEKARLHIEVRNLGPGKSGKTKIYLLNKSSPELFLSKGVESMDQVGPGESKIATMELQYKKPSDKLLVDVRIVTCFEEYHGCYWDSFSGDDDFYRYSEEFVLPTAQATSFQAHQAIYRNSTEQAVPVLTSAQADGLLLAHLPAKALLLTDGQFTGKPFVRTSLKGLGFGFVALAPLQELSAAGKDKANPSALQSAYGFAPPAIAIGDFTYRSSKEKVLLPVTLSHEKDLKDVFVTVKGKKIFYTALSDKDIQRTEQGVQAKLQIPLLLEPGNNFVRIVARASEQLKNSKYMMVYRDLPPSPPAPAPAASSSPAGKAAGAALPATP